MPAEMTDQSGSSSIDAHATGKADAAADRDAKSPQTDPASKPVPPGGQRSTRRRRLLVAVLGVLVLAAALWFGIPYVLLTLSTVSTDDAFVNGHVTFVAARVHGQVSRVDNQIALLRARVAGLEKSRASLKLAQLAFERAKQLIGSTTISQQEYDRREATLTSARAEVTQALADVHQIRASLGLPAQPEGGGDLGQVPPDLDQTFSSVLQAQAELIQSAAELGVVHSYNQTPKQDGRRVRKARSRRGRQPHVRSAGGGGAGRQASRR